MKETTESMKTSTSKAPRFKGMVVSVAAAETITVAVDTYKTHPKYRKKYRSTKKYLVHVPKDLSASKEGSYQIGDVVTFVECRPMSKRKRHIVVKEG